MQRDNITLARRPQESALATNKVLRNTYLLLGLTFLFSAFTALIAMTTHAQPMHPLLMIVGVYGLMFLTSSLKNSVWGIVSVFAFTGFLGYTLGPILNFYIANFSNGHELIMTSLGATGVIFLTLSSYVLVSRKDFSFLGGFLAILGMVAVLAMIAGFFFQIPILNLAISCLFVLFSSGVILYQTSLIINGGETNYIMATITLFVALYNLFISLLQIFGAFSNKE